jgi:hypothetical protein
MADLLVCSFFWLDSARQRNVQITPEDVRIWKNMVDRQMTIPHRTVCVTHRPDLIDFMETIPLDLEKHVPGTCLVKLQAHKIGGVAKEGDRVLTMDVDCVVTGSLDPLVTRDEPAVWWRNPNHNPDTEDGRKRGYVQGSMQLFTVGATEFLWRDFDERAMAGRVNGATVGTVPLNRRFGGAEQCWISERLNAAYPEAGWNWHVPRWTEADGVYGAGRLFNGKMGKGVQSELPDNARIVFTPGDRSPSQPEFRKSHPWVEEYWR